MKTDQNTAIDSLDRLKEPCTSTCIDRYALANSWTKHKNVLDAATGKGYGAGILLSLGAKSVTGIDIDKDAIVEAGNRMASTNCRYLIADIFDLKNTFLENTFDVCTSIETFEHLPPERIDEYLQGLRFVTKETIIITTPRRKTPIWTYNGGTHLYEYDVNEFTDVLTRNFPKSDVTGIGLNEIRLPGGQWGTDVTNDLSNCWVFFAVITLNK